MSLSDDTVFLFDVDNTLLDNDRFQKELRERLSAVFGDRARDRYWAHFERLWNELGYADYLGAVERYRLDDPHDRPSLRLGGWILDYPFANLLYPGAVEAVRHAKKRGRMAILSDPAILAAHPAPDITIERIADLANCDFSRV